MAGKKDWLPAARDAILSAESALNTAKNESTHAPAATVRRGEAFGAPVAEMRDMKRRCFLVPPLTNAGVR